MKPLKLARPDANLLFLYFGCYLCITRSLFNEDKLDSTLADAMPFN